MTRSITRTLLLLAAATACVVARSPTPRFHIDPTTSRYCKWWVNYEGTQGQTCQWILDSSWITEEEFRRWNPSIGVACAGLQAPQSYCVDGFDEPDVPPTTTTGSGTTTTRPNPSTTTTGNGIVTPTPIQPGMVTNCNRFRPVRETTTCNRIINWVGITFAELLRWNPGIGPNCETLWVGTHACVGVLEDEPPEEPDNGIPTPSPVQPGIPTNCNRFQPVRETTTCESIINWTGIFSGDFFTWNPAVGSNCQNLQPGTHACVGVIDNTAANGIETPLPIQPGMRTNCNKFQPVRETTTCNSIINWTGIFSGDFFAWNPDVGSNCQNLQPGTNACVGVIDNTPANGIETPLPIQPGIPTNCNRFQPVRSTTTCNSIINWVGITAAEFYSWNPDVGTNCQNLQVDTNACVGVVNNTPRNGISTPTPNQPGMVSNCNKFHHIRPTTTCEGVLNYNSISLADFVKWNLAVGSTCGSLLANSHACVGVIGGPTPTQPPSGVTTPTPTQAGMVQGCTKFAEIRTTTTCQGVLDWNNISLADFVRWNPAIGSNCQNLWTGTFACVAGP